MVNEITTNQFENIIKKGRVIIDFYASWCGTCKMLANVLEELSEELDESTNFFKVDVEKDMELALQYGVSNLPTVLYFVNGELEKTVSGFQPKNVIRKQIASE